MLCVRFIYILYLHLTLVTQPQTQSGLPKISQLGHLDPECTLIQHSFLTKKVSFAFILWFLYHLNYITSGLSLHDFPWEVLITRDKDLSDLLLAHFAISYFLFLLSTIWNGKEHANQDSITLHTRKLGQHIAQWKENGSGAESFFYNKLSRGKTSDVSKYHCYYC